VRCFPEIPEFFAPLPLAAVVLLVVNDHVLKARFPGLVTGKLSDVAGCFVLPLFVSALLCFLAPWPPPARLVTGGAATVVLFGAIKTWPLAAHAMAAALTATTRPLGLAPSRIVCDPTDLVALPLAAVAVAYGLRVTREAA
jgi:hypothetical protein